MGAGSKEDSGSFFSRTIAKILVPIDVSWDKRL